MILKKPYAFLIKNFKLIHAVLTVLYIYLAFFVSGLLNFYNGFINGSIGKLNAVNYLSNIPYIVIVASIIVCLILFILMKYKKKPKFLYLLLILIYIVDLVIILIATNGMMTIYNNVLETKTVLLYRDLLRIILIFQYGTIVLTTIRAIGFDIKKFNFSEDIGNLNIDVTDDEEVELTMGFNQHKFTQKLNRKIRELKYYYAENKLFVLISLAVIILLGLSTITIDKTIVNKVYKQNETFSSDNFDMQITNSYITNKSYNGEILKDNGAFLIIKLSVNPKTDNATLNTANVVLKTNKNKYTNTLKYYSYFKDLGTGYKNQVIKNYNTYLLVYEIKEEDISNNFYINYSGNVKDTKIDLSPINLDNNEKKYEYTLSNPIDLSNTVLSSFTFQINSYEIKDKFTYNYTYEIDGKSFEGKKYITSPSNMILYLDITSSLSNITNYDLINNYGNILYKKDDVEYTSQRKEDKTPGNYKKGIYIEVDKNIEDAQSIWLELNIRNVTIKYILK